MRIFRVIPFTTLIATVLLCPIQRATAEEKKVDPAAEPIPTAASEHVCEADIFYSWQRVPASTAGQAPNPGGAPEAAAAPNAELYKPIEVFSTKAIARAATREEAELTLRSKLIEYEAKARKSCETEHQNQGSCTASMLRNIAPDMRNMDFDSRHALLGQVSEDCSKNTGICLSTRSSDPSCRELKAEQKDEAATPAADAGKKPAGDKKKK